MLVQSVAPGVARRAHSLSPPLTLLLWAAVCRIEGESWKSSAVSSSNVSYFPANPPFLLINSIIDIWHKKLNKERCWGREIVGIWKSEQPTPQVRLLLKKGQGNHEDILGILACIGLCGHHHSQDMWPFRGSGVTPLSCRMS